MKGRIPIDALADISEVLEYVAGVTPEKQQAWLGSLTPTEFNDAYCTKKTKAEVDCPEVYDLSAAQYKEAKDSGELLEVMDKDEFKNATQAIIDHILNKESQSWLAAFIKGYNKGGEDEN